VHSPSYGPLFPPVGTVVAEKYEVLSYLGEGGMGAVAKATNRLTGAVVALKFISPHILSAHGAVERFLNEAQAATRIRSAHVVTIFDVAKQANGAPFMVMECLDGRDLAALLEKEGIKDITVARAIHFVLQILRALRVAHSAGIIHRDLKPSNCFIVQEDGEDDFVKIVDFGISKVQQPGGGSLTATNHALGTPLYMSPEQAKSPRDVDLRTDLYSVGVILYELLSGRTPHSSDSGELTEILFKLFTAEPDSLAQLRPDLPPELCAAVHRCIARERDTRPANAGEMAEVLAPWADARSQHILRRLRAPQEVRAPGPAPMSAQQSVEALAQLGSSSMPPPDIRHSGGPVYSHVPQGHSPHPSQPPPAFSTPPLPVIPGPPAVIRQASITPDPAYRSVDAAAATQMSGEASTRGPIPTPSHSMPPKTPPLLIGAAGALLLGALVGGGLWLSSVRGGKATQDPAVLQGNGGQPVTPSAEPSAAFTAPVISSIAPPPSAAPGTPDAGQVVTAAAQKPPKPATSDKPAASQDTPPNVLKHTGTTLAQ
jgi:serine/threonine protein kinase